MIVGQETNGWDYLADEGAVPVTAIRTFHDFSACDTGVESMMRAYERFLYESEPWKRNSAFWRAFRLLSAVLGEQAPSILWTNIFKFDVEGSVIRNCSRLEREVIMAAQKDVLKLEIRLLSPDVIVFFSGPTYDGALQVAFSDLTFHQFDSQTATRELAVVRSESLTPLCLRSFHPSYLQRSKRDSGILIWPSMAV